MSDRPITKLPWGLRNDKLAPGSMKTITETKIKAFQQGAMNIAKKTLSKRELEEIKRKQQEEEAAEVYKDFVASFEDPNKIGKTFVKGTTIQTGLKTTETPAVDRGRIYKPTSKLQELAETFSSFKACSDKSTSQTGPTKPKKQQEKRKTNLEAFKDELKRIQEERDRRHEIKRKIKEQEESGRKSRFEPYIPPENPIDSELSLDDAAQERYSSDDPNTTNIFLSNLSRTLNEMEIMEMFGQFGPLASVKIMYPRSDEERARGSNCGFVAFMNRRDAEVAITELDGFEVGGLRLRLSWGKQVHIPLQPVYVPPSLVEANLHPPPKSGYPFNAQPPPNFPRYPDVIKPTQQQIKQALENSVIKVIVPSDRKLLCLIHRTIEFVIREGPKFESLLMEKEKENPQFKFLFDNDLPTHIYYRWKLFSILQGDSVYQWRTGHFKMFKQGSLWIPPSIPIAKHDSVASYDESFERAKAELGDKKNKLGSQKCDKMQEMLKNLTTERDIIADAMIYAIEHAHIADEIANTICRSLATPDSTGPQKVAHLFLISDILHNCSFGVFNASSYRRVFEGRLPAVFENLRLAASDIGGKVKTEQFKSKVIACFRAWEDWTVYPSDMLIKLQNIFFGLVKTEAASSGRPKVVEGETEEIPSSNIDTSQRQTDLGIIDDSDIDGQPIDESEEAEYVGLSTGNKNEGEQLEDIDGEPLDASDIDDGAPRITERGFFVSSKWETIDPKTVTMEAMNAPRWNEIRQLDTSQLKDSASSETNAAQLPEPINSRTELRSRCNSFDSSLSVSQSSSTTANDQARRSPSSSPNKRSERRRGRECHDRQSRSESYFSNPEETERSNPDTPGGRDRRLTASPQTRNQYREVDSDNSSMCSPSHRRRAHDRSAKTRGHGEGQQRPGRDYLRRSRRSTDSSGDSDHSKRRKSCRKRSRRDDDHSSQDNCSDDGRSSTSSHQQTQSAKSLEDDGRAEGTKETRKSREMSPPAKASVEATHSDDVARDKAGCSGDDLSSASRSRTESRQTRYHEQPRRESSRHCGQKSRRHTRHVSPQPRSGHYLSNDDTTQSSRSHGGGMSRYRDRRQSDESDRPADRDCHMGDDAGQYESSAEQQRGRAGQFGRLSSSISAPFSSDRNRKDGRRL